MAAFLAAILAGGVAGGVLWLFVFGDDVWPETAETVVVVFAAIVSVATLITLLSVCYAFGKKRERLGDLARQHVVLAILISVALPALALFHQWRVGNLGGW